MQEVPVPLTAVSSRALADFGIRNITDLSAVVPSLVVSTNSGPFRTSYRIRGIGNEGNIPTFEPATGLFVDGVYRSRSGLGLGNMIDIESIEVLKGPQSTLYGKNVTAGVISVSISQEFRVASNDDGVFDWLAGLFYYKNDYDRGGSRRGEFELLGHVEEFGSAVARELAVQGDLLFPFPVDAPLLGVEGDKGYFRGSLDTEAFAGYTHFTAAVSEALELVAGIRYSYEEKAGAYRSRNRLSALGCVPPTNLNIICTLAPEGLAYQDNDSWDAWTGSLSASFFPVTNILLYASYATGFKSGGFNLEFGDAPEETRSYDDEEVENFEIGWKSELFDRRMRVNGSLFHTTYDDYQNATFVGLQFTVNNAEEVVVQGIELETNLLLGESLTVMLSATYLDPVYKTYTGGSCYYGRPADNPQLGQCDLSGENVPFAPKWSGNTALKWERPFARGNLYARASFQYTGKHNPSSELNPVHQRDGYGLLAARLGWRNGSIDISAWGKNLTDETYLVQGAPANLNTSIDAGIGSSKGSYQTFIGEPRTAGVTARVYY